MMIHSAVFFGLLLLAILPAYAFSAYAFYNVKKITDLMTKLAEQDIVRALSSGSRGSSTPTVMTADELASLLKPPAKKDDKTVPPAPSGHYL